MIQPHQESDVVAAISDAAATFRRLAIVSGGSKSGVGAPGDATSLELAGLNGIVDYDPAELVLTLRPGTRLAELEVVLAGERQMLAFEPYDHGPIFGRPVGDATIGGVVSAGVAGSRRLSAGGARDHLLGMRAVSGRGQVFVAGAKVVKNVTGYDLPKLAAGSWGRLFAVTEMTLKVLPRPEMTTTIAVAGLEVEPAVALMAHAMSSQADVGAAAHRPALGGAPALTCLRIEGFGPSVAARSRMIRTLATGMDLFEMEIAEAQGFWSDMRTLAPLGNATPLWRINVPPSEGAGLVKGLAADGARWLLDWAGGLAWIAFEGEPSRVRAAASAAGGHAILMRGPDAMRREVPAFHPPTQGVASLEERVRRAFDPVGVFETGRF